MAIPGPDPASLSRVDSAYNQLRKAIIDGEYPPGAPLRHSELTDAFGVSLIPIREAIRKLEVERLVTSIPNRGAWVAPISLEDVRDVYDTRVVLEVEALRRAWPRLSDEGTSAIREVRDRMVGRKRRDNRFYALHRQFHFDLYDMSESPWLVHMIEILWSHTERYRRLAARIRNYVVEGADMHSLVLDAIDQGDLAAAQAALQEDLERTANLILETYETSQAG